MAKPTTPEPENKRDPVKPIDFSKPVAVLVRQTPTRNVFTVITGDTPEAVLISANETAAKMALDLGATVGVFGPQRTAYVPPPPAAAAQLGMSFAGDDKGD